MIKMAIFDFDDTLIDTSIYKSYRDSKNWDLIDSYLNEFTPIGKAKEAIDLLKAKGVIITILTKSNGNKYAKKILDKFQIQYDVFYSFNEINEKKLKYTSFKTGAICYLKNQYDLKSNEIFFVGDSDSDFKACEESNIMFITHPNSQAYKDFNKKIYCVDNYIELVKLLDDSSLNNHIKIHYGKCQNTHTEYISFSNYITDIYPKLKINEKEFNVSFDAMHKRIKEIKNTNTSIYTIKWLTFLKNINWEELFPNIDYVTRVLGSSELEIQTSIIKPLDIISYYISSKISADYKKDILKQKNRREKLSHSNLGYEGRKKILEDNYESIDINNKNILLLDDIITTGATTEAIMNTIRVHNPNSHIQCCSLARTINFNNQNYLDNINNLKYFPCIKIDSHSFNLYHSYLVLYLFSILEDEKIYYKKDTYFTGVLLIQNIKIFDKENKYLYFSVKMLTEDSFDEDNMYTDFFDCIDNIKHPNPSKNKFINNAISYFN